MIEVKSQHGKINLEPFTKIKDKHVEYLIKAMMIMALSTLEDTTNDRIIIEELNNCINNITNRLNDTPEESLYDVF